MRKPLSATRRNTKWQKIPYCITILPLYHEMGVSSELNTAIRTGNNTHSNTTYHQHWIDHAAAGTWQTPWSLVARTFQIDLWIRQDRQYHNPVHPDLSSFVSPLLQCSTLDQISGLTFHHLLTVQSQSIIPFQCLIWCSLIRLKLNEYSISPSIIF